MIKNVYCIRDVHVGFLTPVLDDNDDTARRNFAYAVNDSKSLLYFRPKDFSLYRLGTFDTDTAKFNQEYLPELIIDGEAVKEV